MTHPSMAGLRLAVHDVVHDEATPGRRARTGDVLGAIAAYLVEHDVGWFGGELVRVEHPSGCLGCSVLVGVEVRHG